MKRYLVFGFSNYYPSGGWEDHLGSFETLEAAKTFLDTEKEDLVYFGNKLSPKNYWDYIQIVDLETGKEIEDE